MRIFLINWQDRENPQAGGAEIHMHEIFGRLVARGHRVRALVSGWPGAEAHVQIDGIDIHRVGGRHSFGVLAVREGRTILSKWPADVVVEDINKMPLYAPWWVTAPVVALVPHLFGTTAFREASLPVAAAVWAAERSIPRVYRGCEFQAISHSTALDLEERGISAGRIAVIPPGIDHDWFRPGDVEERAAEPTVLYVGRLKKYKGLDVLLEALARVRAGPIQARLVIAGRGDDRGRLEACARALGIEDAVTFTGYIGETEKLSLIRRAWVLAYPSPKEGWGIANVEAAACGTPVVASDSPGLRESVHEGISGLLVTHSDVAAWVEALGALLESASLRERMGRGGVEHAAQFSWNRAAEETEAHLVHTVMGPGDNDTRNR